MRLRDVAAVGFAGLTLAVAMWTVVPAPNLPLLALAVAAPYGVVVALAALLLARRAARGRARSAAATLAALAVACFVWPLLAAPFAWAGAHRALAATGIAPLRAAGKTVVALELPWANHAFDEVNGLGAALAHDATLRLLDATLR